MGVDFGAVVTALSGALVPIIGVVGGIAVARVWKPGEREGAMIDQLQEDRKEDRARIDLLESKLADLEREVHRLMGRDLLWQRHAGRLEDQLVAHGYEPVARPPELVSGGAV